MWISIKHYLPLKNVIKLNLINMLILKTFIHIYGLGFVCIIIILLPHPPPYLGSSYNSDYGYD